MAATVAKVGGGGGNGGGGGGGSSVGAVVLSLPPPCPKSPPKYPDLYGKRREMAKLQMLEREIGFLQEELKSVERLQPSSRCCKEVNDSVLANSDPIIPSNRKNRKSYRFWKWLCRLPCFHLLCTRGCCGDSSCSLRVEWSRCFCCCRDHNCHHSNCCNCDSPCHNCGSCMHCMKCQCCSCSCSCSCPTPNCCCSIKDCRCCSFPYPRPSCPNCSSCCKWTFSCPKCPPPSKVCFCSNCFKSCCNACCLFL